MVSVYAGDAELESVRRADLLAQRGLERVAVALRELVDARRRASGPRRARGRRTRAAACGRRASTLTHRRRRGTNSAASRPSSASTANASTQVAAASRWIDSETNRLTDSVVALGARRATRSRT